MNDIQGYERIIQKRTEGKLLLAKIALIFAYVFFASAGFLLIFIFADGSPALLLTVGALTSALIFITWRFTCVEYEYSMVAGSFYLAKIYGKSSRKEIFEAEISRATVIAPYNENYSDKADNCRPHKIFYANSSNSAENVWFVIFDDEQTKTLIFFEADERAVSIFRRLAPRATANEKITSLQNIDGGDDNA